MNKDCDVEKSFSFSSSFFSSYSFSFSSFLSHIFLNPSQGVTTARQSGPTHTSTIRQSLAEAAPRSSSRAQAHRPQQGRPAAAGVGGAGFILLLEPASLEGRCRPSAH